MAWAVTVDVVWDIFLTPHVEEGQCNGGGGGARPMRVGSIYSGQ
jgi:hypothetical protein